jgi:hypothetical protein
MSMTWDKWQKLSPSEKEAHRTFECLTPQLKGLEGRRVEVETTYGEKRRFWVGRSTGWEPIHLEVKRSDSTGGEACEREYKSVRVVR